MKQRVDAGIHPGSARAVLSSTAWWTTLIFLTGLVLLALGGIALLNYATEPGMGLVNDSVAYVNGARSLLAGDGYGRMGGDGEIRPITHFPPLFSLLLAGIGLFGLDAIPAARLANLALFGLNIGLMGLLARALTRSVWFGLLAAGLFALCEPLLRVHSFALSEPLFLALTLGALLCLQRAGTGTNRAGWLLLAGFLAGLSYLTRYVGAALLAAVLLALLLGPRSWKDRLRDAASFLAAVVPLLAAWSLRNALLTGSATNRGLAWHPIAPSELAEGLRNGWDFLLPSRLELYDRLPAWLWAVLLAALLALLVGWVAFSLIRSWRFRAAPGLGALIGLHALAYLGVVIVSMTVADASTIFENRILAPLYAGALLLFVLLLSWIAARPAPRWARLAVPILSLALLLTFADDGRKAAIDLHRVGQGFAGPAWTNSLTVIAVKKLPDVTIYTNRLSAVSILTHRPAYALLSPTDPVSEQERPDYERTQAQIRQNVLAGRAVLVVFDARDLLQQPDAGWFRDLSQDLPVLDEFDDGIIYGISP